MTADIYEGPDMYVTRYVGPADEGIDRQRWQFTTLDKGGCASLTRLEVLTLLGALDTDLRSHEPPRTEPDETAHPLEQRPRSSNPPE